MRADFFLTRRGDLLVFGYEPPGTGHRFAVSFTTRVGGRSRGPWRFLNPDPRGGEHPATIKANQRRILRALDLPGIFLPRQVHGTRILVHPGGAEGFAWGGEGDAVVIDSPGNAAGIMTADCLPVLLWHRRAPAAAAVHAGWRSLSEGIVPSAARLLLAQAGGIPRDLGAWLGPAIRPCCYEVGRDVADAIARAAGRAAIVETGGERPRADLHRAAELQLLAAGFDREAIACAPLCTSCNPDLFYSYRRDGAQTGRMTAVIAVRS